MGILEKILDQDLHRSRKSDAIPYMTEIAAIPNLFPVVVSNARGGFVISPKPIGSMARVGVFEYDLNNIDELISPMMKTCFELSKSQNFENVFKTPTEAFDYIKETSGLENQPHVCLVPNSWGQSKTKKWLGKSGEKRDIEEGEKSDSIVIVPRISYKKVCRVLECGVDIPVFLSRPDFVGMYTRFMGVGNAILLHNVRMGLAFVECD
jgi:hypothetical protein